MIVSERKIHWQRIVYKKNSQIEVKSGVAEHIMVFIKIRTQSVVKEDILVPSICGMSLFSRSTRQMVESILTMSKRTKGALSLHAAHACPNASVYVRLYPSKKSVSNPEEIDNNSDLLPRKRCIEMLRICWRFIANNSRYALHFKQMLWKYDHNTFTRDYAIFKTLGVNKPLRKICGFFFLD